MDRHELRAHKFRGRGGYMHGREQTPPICPSQSVWVFNARRGDFSGYLLPADGDYGASSYGALNLMNVASWAVLRGPGAGLQWAGHQADRRGEGGGASTRVQYGKGLAVVQRRLAIGPSHS